MTAMNTSIDLQFFNSCYHASNRQPSAAIDDVVDRMLHHTLSMYPVDELVDAIHKQGVDAVETPELAARLADLHDKCRNRGIFIDYLVDYEDPKEYGHTCTAVAHTPKGLREVMRDYAYNFPRFKGMRLWFDGATRGKEYVGESDILNAWLDGEEVVFSLRMTRHGRVVADANDLNWWQLRIETSHCICRAVLDGLL